jgi:hypothetical protein
MRALYHFTFMILLGVAAMAPAAEERIVLDQSTGNYVITYKVQGKLERTVFVPANKIEPTVTSIFTATARGSVVYRYQIENKETSPQDVALFMLNAADINSSLVTPPGWDGNVVPNFYGTGLRIGWSYQSQDPIQGLAPGLGQGGFGFESNALPGIGVVRLFGATPILRFADHGPRQAIADQLDKLQNETKNSVPRPAAVPLIPNPDPFEAADVLSHIQDHVKELAAMELVEPVFAGRLDAMFTTAINALARHDTESAISYINALREIIREAQAVEDAKQGGEDEGKEEKISLHRPIPPLAARIVSFDLAYVQEHLAYD